MMVKMLVEANPAKGESQIEMPVEIQPSNDQGDREFETRSCRCRVFSSAMPLSFSSLYVCFDI